MLPQTAARKECRVIRAGFAPKRAAAFLEGYPELLGVPDLERLTGQSAQTIRAAINSGQLPGCRIGWRLYVPKPAFVEYVTNGGGMDGR